MQKPQEPLIHHKLVVRTVIFLFSLAVLVYGFNWIRTRGNDLDVGTADTKGWIAALQTNMDSKTQMVVIKPDGTIMPSAGYTAGSNDRDFAWRPDGNRVFFSSNREDHAFNIYRWNLASGKVERRSFGKIAKSDLSFPVGPPVETNTNPLMIYGGMAWELDVSDGKATQIAPAIAKDKDPQMDTNAEAGSESVLSYGTGAQYKARSARFFSGKKWVAVIRRTEYGDLLVVQKVGSTDPKDRPITLAAGDKIAMDVNPNSGKLFYTLTGFQWTSPEKIPEEFIKNGVAQKPFEHIISSFSPENPDSAEPIGVSLSSDCFSQPAISPDGGSLLITLGKYRGSGEFEPRVLLTMPAADGGLRQATPLYPPLGKAKDETIWNPHWSPDGKRICFVLVSKEAKERSICVIDKDGENFKNLTKGKGNFSFPVFSPQQ